MQFMISVRSDGPTRTLHLTGDLDLAARPVLIGEVDRALNDPAVGSLVIDLAALEFLDCTGIGALVHASNTAIGHGRDFAIRNAHGMPAEILRRTGVYATEESRT
jgi:anti-sigma B factor antagonist